MKAHSRIALSYLPYLLLGLGVMGPLLLPGFVLTMDMVFAPVMRMPNHVDNTWLFYASLHVLNRLLPADFIQKCMLLSILVASGIGAHRLLWQLRPDGEKFPRNAIYVGAALYMINPFVYDRFMAGQYGVLLGYCLLPWFARSLWLFTHRPAWKQALRVTAWVVAMSVVSIHSLGWVIVLVGCAVIWSWKDKEKLAAFVKFGMAGVIIFAITGAYWLLPAITGQGRIANSLATFSPSERQAFSTVDPNSTTTPGAVLGLQGFWEEVHQLYILPIDAMYAWGIALLLFYVFVGIGVWRSWQTQRRVAGYGLAVVTIALVLSVGVGGDWMAAHIPFFAGFREPQKFVALIALAYAYFAMWSAAWILSRAGHWRSGAVYPVSALLLVFILAYTTPMLWGFDGQLQPVHYPRDWSTMNQVLDQQPGNGKVLFLPWHLYMSFGFSGRIIANPAADFFDRPMVVSDDPELPGVAPQTRNATRSEVQKVLLPAGAQGGSIAAGLRSLNIGYILVAKDLDWQKYDWLNHQAGISLIRETATLKLYKVTNDTIGWHETN